MAGYQGQRGWNPVGLGVAIAINGGVLAVLVAMTPPPPFFSDPSHSMEVVNIRMLPPPPPIDDPKPVERTVSDPAPVPKPYVPPSPFPQPGPTIDSVDVIPPGPPPLGLPTAPERVGTGSAPVATPAPPVLVGSSVDPRYRGDFQPDYPAIERNLGRDGFVTVRVLVGSDGRVEAIEPVRSTSDAFFQATKRRALSKWRFRPATRDGVPVESWREMTVRFTMEDA